MEDSVFSPFIFHPHLPSSTRRFRDISEYNPLIYNRKKFTFQVKISFRAFCFPLMFNRKWYTIYLSPHTWAHEPRCPG
ncbi:hypothetical protein EC81_005865 [Bacteroides fragilis]|uniref:Uncharacterized protein n=1 Tax=Bacteroides fragilis TaxID=817 RepID=A0A3E5CS49_BACFG|nr:hypothetical protein EC80_005875 [Bacteroides fragilis]QLK81806.1 hypothetical protein DBK98_006400 [Bacteroides sp. PHL 2737]QCQ53378.1 hypothetical protein EC81_005865 [Bacteroides fragilis]QRM69435.1 hypothetical protein F7887_05260 [Bacteroides fragilis]RGN61754.1 hypothetical protein DXB57_08820 [Bacteroides fragilis]